jgi:site-specific DNA-methyltransferase (adenine-specific)
MMEISKIVKKISLLHSSSTETPTSFALAVEIISCIPINWKNPNLKILDPACGRGTFLLAVMSVLEKAGHDRKHIIENMLYGVDLNKVQAMIAKKAFNLACPEAEVNIYCEDSLTKVWNMKFDVVVGNPPFQSTDASGDRKSMSTNLWSKFTLKAFDLVKENGVIAFITPASWASDTVDINQGKIRLFKDVFIKNNPIMINLHTIKKHFANVGSTFSAFVIQKHKNAGHTELVTEDGSIIIVDTSTLSSLPKVVTRESISINQKFSSLMSSNATCAGQMQSKACRYSEAKGHNFKFPAYHTPAVANAGKTWYTNVEHPNLKKEKIIFSLSGYFQPYADSGIIGYTDMCLAYILKTGEKLEYAYQVFNSKLFRFYLENNKWSGFNPKEIIRSFPVLDFTRAWTDAEIYQHFNLTSNEIKYVESNTK